MILLHTILTKVGLFVHFTSWQDGTSDHDHVTCMFQTPGSVASCVTGRSRYLGPHNISFCSLYTFPLCAIYQAQLFRPYLAIQCRTYALYCVGTGKRMTRTVLRKSPKSCRASYLHYRKRRRLFFALRDIVAKR